MSDWKTLEPFVVTSIIALIGWSLIEITNMKVNVGKIQTEVSYIREDIKSIKQEVVSIGNDRWKTEIHASK